MHDERCGLIWVEVYSNVVSKTQARECLWEKDHLMLDLDLVLYSCEQCVLV